MKLFLNFLLLLPLSAASQDFDKGYSTWTVAGVYCTSGTAAEISGSIDGFNIAAYRLINQDTTAAVWLGYSSSVSTGTALVATGVDSNLGEKLAAGESGVWNVGKNPDIGLALLKLYCKAADAAGATGVRLSRALFGWK